MKDKEKKVEEMAKYLERIEKEEGHKLVNETFAYVKQHHRYNSLKDFAKAHDKTIYQRTAEALYNAGYRKVGNSDFESISEAIEYFKEQAVKEFAEKLKERSIRQQEYIGGLAIKDTKCIYVSSIDETLKEVIGEKE